jgi:hypothetical protein
MKMATVEIPNEFEMVIAVRPLKIALARKKSRNEGAAGPQSGEPENF